MELSEAIRGRRSVRRFRPDPVPRKVLEGILESAIWAPSAMNRQEWYFVVVQGQKVEEMKKIFADAFLDLKPRLEKVFADKPKVIAATKAFFETYGGAPVFIFAYGGKSPDGISWDTHSTAVAVQNLQLAAYEAGLGCTWTDGIMGKEKEISEALGIKDKKLVCVLPMGYPAETPKVPPRRDGRIAWMGF
jgi:nitroreductase